MNSIPSRTKALIGVSFREFARYALPSIIGMLIVGLQTIIDGLFVGRGVGALGLAAVNIAMPLISSMLSVSIMIISGGIVITGIAKGQGDEARAKGYTSLTFVTLLVTIAALSVLVGLFLKPMCYFLGSNDEVYPFVRQYLGIIGCGFIFYCIPNFTEAFTRLNGKPNWVFVSGVICCVVNIVLDYFFVLRFGWGVAGAAIATCIANTTAALVLFRFVRFGKMMGGRKEIRKIFFNGSSEMLTSVSAAVTTYIFNLVLMREIGTKGVAAFTIVCYLNFIVNMSIFGLSQAMYPLMSYSVGAQNHRRVQSLLVNALLLGGGIGIGVYLLVLIFKHGIASAFSNGDLELQTLTTMTTTYVTLHYLVSFVNIVACSFHTAIERPLESVFIALCRSIVFVLIPMFLLTPIIGQKGIWLSMPIAEVMTLMISIPLVLVSMKRLTSKS